MKGLLKRNRWLTLAIGLCLSFTFVVATQAALRTQYAQKMFEEGEEDTLHIRGPNGKTLYSIKVYEESLKKDTLITMEAVYDTEACTIDFEFGPHGTQFEEPIRLRLSKQMLINRGIDPDDIVLYYFDEEVGEWVEETHGIERDNAVILELNHFSRYYFERR